MRDYGDLFFICVLYFGIVICNIIVSINKCNLNINLSNYCGL